jgi:hypothetical protein
MGRDPSSFVDDQLAYRHPRVNPIPSHKRYFLLKIKIFYLLCETLSWLMVVSLKPPEVTTSANVLFHQLNRVIRQLCVERRWYSLSFLSISFDISPFNFHCLLSSPVCAVTSVHKASSDTINLKINGHEDERSMHGPVDGLTMAEQLAQAFHGEPLYRKIRAHI